MNPIKTEPRDHLFFSGMSIAAATAIILGFSNTYGRRLATGGEPVHAIVHVHAAVFATWVALFVAQAVLVIRGRIDLHRKAGNAGMILAAVMLVLGAVTSVVVTRQGHRGIPGVEFPDPAGFLLLNLAALWVFSALVFAGWMKRNDPQSHKRFMLVALVAGLAPPGIARMPFVAGNEPAIALFAMAFLLAGPAYDLTTRRKLHPAYFLAIPIALTSIPPLIHALGATAVWQSIAGMLLG